jgi:hypothetical protein
MQAYNTYDYLQFFTSIWVVLKHHHLRRLAVAFVRKLMHTHPDDPSRNKFMMGFANNGECTIENLNYLAVADTLLATHIYNTYTTPAKKELLSYYRWPYTKRCCW